MRNNGKTCVVAALLAFGAVTFAGSAFAGPTTDQAAAESDLPAAAATTSLAAQARGQGIMLPDDQAGSPANASNGLAQGRIFGGQAQ